jgi:ElaB/YqjD/DUF883 family membrane-anchored ribosome-binding protein
MATTSTSNYPGSASSTADHESDDSLKDRVAAESNRVMQQLRDGTDAVVEKMQPQIEAVSTYARSEPTKAVLMAAAAGAALMGLIALMARPSGRSSAASSFASMRDAAIGYAGRATSSAEQALGAAQRRADAAEDRAHQTQKRFSELQKRAGETADEVSTAVSDTWQSLRDQAAPVVDRLRPQFDAVANYAKEDPARAAIGVATVAAAVLGLITLINKARED